MADVEHKRAVYWDTEGLRRTIKFEELKDNDTFERAKLLELFDESEQVRVFPREGVRRHFYAESVPSRTFDRGESSPAHNQRVAFLLSQVNLLEGGWTFGYQARASSPILPIFTAMPKYSWGDEVTRILNRTASVRHDLYGDSGIRMSTRRPSIAIEVVQSHFPEELTFAAMLEQSQAIPATVLFDFTSKSPNTFVNVNVEQQVLSFRSYTFSVHDGSVWEGDQRRGDISTSARLKIEVEELLRRWDASKRNPPAG